MKRLSCLWIGLVVAALAWTGWGQGANQLTEKEKSDGWKLLYDGKSLAGWHTFRKQTAPAKGWEVQGEWLHCLPKGGGGEIVSDELYDQFDLTWEWKIAADGNSGVKYFVADNRPSPLGHEYQMYDDPKSKNAPPEKHETASFYDVLKPAVKPPVSPVGEINKSRVTVKGNHVEHWLNGVMVLAYDCGSEEVKKAVSASKFKTTPAFGTRLKGHILLQDHGTEVWFRNVKIRKLD